MENEMEQWEIDLRSKLEQEVEDGYYTIKTDKFAFATGKGGYINYHVAFEKVLRNYTINMGEGIESQINKSEKQYYKDLTEEDIREFIKNLYNSSNE